MTTKLAGEGLILYDWLHYYSPKTTGKSKSNGTEVAGG